ncbi:asparagine synthase C-terminal domain-containing protein [Patescibacteria group bacterium]|nr:asparagine synthase C-terminal domain-containing protein [Patescibacteria group bacterium]
MYTAKERLTSWRNAIHLPIIKEWSLEELEMVLYESAAKCAAEAYDDHFQHTRICMTLSGGLDSSLNLALTTLATKEMSSLNIPIIRAFTLGKTEIHPDIFYAKIATKKFSAEHFISCHTDYEIKAAKKRFEKALPEFAKQPGNLGTFMLYEDMASYFTKRVIAHDGIDELMGGYWPHRKYAPNEEKMAPIFLDFWNRLKSEHLIPLEKIAKHFDIEVIFPYLQNPVVRYISMIPLKERTSREESKIPLRRIAEKYLPREIIERKKIGFCDALKEF